MSASLSQMSLRACETLKPFALSLSISPVLFPNAPCARSDNCDNRPPSPPAQRPRTCRTPRCVGAASGKGGSAMRPVSGLGVLRRWPEGSCGVRDAPRDYRETFALRQFQVTRSLQDCRLMAGAGGVKRLKPRRAAARPAICRHRG